MRRYFSTVDSRFANIKVIAWDVDTTLYQNIPELSQALKNGFIEVVAEKKNLPLDQAATLFEKERSKYNASTMALLSLGVGDYHTILEVQKKINKQSYIKKDAKLPAMFKKLSRFRHFVITNSMLEDDLATLTNLGLSLSLFERIITPEDTGKSKPDLAPFKFLLKLTGLPPAQHVYVGDREKVDIEPAKKLGMKTILVWGKSKLADLS
ncbi:HAD family hydrolase, partial [Candidatus Gottesmanbacteria bacterium]|nr:HAD family hydrolase [Candidatus Gottesmanbacteria bacterium]